MSSNQKTPFTVLNTHTYLPPVARCTTPVLDLCIRQRVRTPSLERAHHQSISMQKVQLQRSEEQPTTTTCYSSPRSHSDSDTSEISTSSDLMREFSTYVPNTLQKIKTTRPFKAYPKDPLSIAAGVATAEALLGKDSADAYTEFRKHMLSQVQANHGIINKNMRRNHHPNSNSRNDDPNYWEKRRKNNEAAKRSRDARRAKEDEIAIRCAFLEQENLKLRFEVAALRNESERLRNMIYP